MPVFEICVALVTVAFIVLVVYCVITMNAVRHSLRHINSLTIHLDTTLEPLSEETIKILQNTNQALDPLLQSISTVGESLQRVTSSLNEDTRRTHSPRKDKLSKMCELVALSVLVWQQLNKRR